MASVQPPSIPPDLQHPEDNRPLRGMSAEEAHDLAARINAHPPLGSWQAYAILARDMADLRHSTIVVVATHVPCGCEYVVEDPAQWFTSLRLHADT